MESRPVWAVKILNIFRVIIFRLKNGWGAERELLMRRKKRLDYIKQYPPECISDEEVQRRDVLIKQYQTVLTNKYVNGKSGFKIYRFKVNKNKSFKENWIDNRKLKVK